MIPDMDTAGRNINKDDVNRLEFIGQLCRKGVGRVIRSAL